MSDTPQLHFPPQLLHPQQRERLEAAYRRGPVEGDRLLTAHQQRVDQHFTAPLRDIARGRQPTEAELRMLEETLLVDLVQTAILGAHHAQARQVVLDRIRVMHMAWPGFSRWWREHFTLRWDEDDRIPVDSLWRVYIPFSQWIVEQARSKPHTDVDPNGLYIVGFYGSQGRGKTVTSRALVPILNSLLDPETEGQAVARALDDYYHSQAVRDQLRAHRYDPGVAGVSNRGPAGTHDTAWLQKNLQEFRRRTPASTIRVGNYEKRLDDYPPEVLYVQGKVKIFLLDGWFMGCNTDFDINRIPEGHFSRTVAKALVHDYKPIFDQLDALWAFDTPSFEEILRNREQQEQQQEQQRGSRQMTPPQIEAFIRYFYQMSWERDVTSPIPAMQAMTFYVTIYPNRRFAAIQRGGRAQHPPSPGAG